MMLSIQDLPLHQSDEEVEKLTRLLDMAFWHNQAGNQEAAITACEAALALNPNSTTAHSLLGTLSEKAGNDDKAIRHFEAVLSLNPDSPADAAKLEQLRRGVHVRAVAPPIAHQWLPPAMLKFGPQLGQKWAVLASSSSAHLTQADPQRKRLLAACSATALVAVGGLILAHPWAQAETVRTYPVTTAAAPPVSVSRSAFAPGPRTASSLPPPMVLLPSRANSNAPGLPAGITANDPFAGHIPLGYTSAASVPSGAGSPLWTLPAVPRSAARRRTGQDLPPLRLAALPAVGSVAPAPVALPPGLAPADVSAAPETPLPRHTVMVGDFSPAASAATSSSPYQSSLSSHIRITVHQSADTDAPRTAAQNSASGSVPSGSGQGEALQQQALSLQEAGSYSQARQAYQSAIRSYQSQIAAGQNTETAQRGLAACQTGLQICEQSQP